MQNSEAFQEKFNALRTLYARDLGGKIAALSNAIDVALKEGSLESLSSPRLMAHSLAGSGTTFGFPSVSQAARRIEQHLKNLIAVEIPLNIGNRNIVDEALEELRQAAQNNVATPPSEAKSTSATEHGAKNPALVLSPPTSTKKLLLIGDEHASPTSMAGQFGYLGYQVSSMDNLSDDVKPCAILVETGFKDIEKLNHQLEQLRAQHTPDIPVLFLSTQDNMQARLAAVRAGGRAFFTHPIDVGAVIDVIDEFGQEKARPPLRILIVDDQEAMTRYYARILAESGLTTRVELNPLHVLDSITEFDPDLLLIDMYMPHCSGIELARVIRQQKAFVSIPIVYLSSETDVEMKLEAMRHGGDDFLSKPVDPSFLASTVKTRALRHQTIRSHIVRDGLTGLLNHTRFKEQLHTEISKARRSGDVLSLVMLDLDHFKQVNDRYGHPAGDRVLRLLGKFLEQRLGKTDICGRFGGEEFGIILAKTPAAEALKIIDTLRQDFLNLQHTADGQSFRVSFSAGIADSVMFEAPSQLIKYADQALYQAKHKGRNRIEVFQTTPCSEQ